MEQLFSTICLHAEWAPEILFLLLMIAGLNIPISEDLILITAGALTALCISDHHLKMFIFVYLGCWMSAWECYAIGYLFGPKLYEIKWFNRWINPASVARIHEKIEHYKYLTFFVGRFIPGGFRNTLFMTCGLGKMPFRTFIFRDGIAVLLSSFVIFHIGFFLAQYYSELIHSVRKYETYFLILVCIIIGGIMVFLRSKSQKSEPL